MLKYILAALVISAASPVHAASDHFLPDPSHTPGAVNKAITQDNINRNICKKGWSTKSIRPKSSYTTRLKKQQLVELGYRDKDPKKYEEDHLISLEIGGNPTDPKNLWPEPWDGTWGAYVKDRLENHLHKLVCSGDLTLRQAQEAASKNWIEAYKKYLPSK